MVASADLFRKPASISTYPPFHDGTLLALTLSLFAVLCDAVGVPGGILRSGPLICISSNMDAWGFAIGLFICIHRVALRIVPQEWQAAWLGLATAMLGLVVLHKPSPAPHCSPTNFSACTANVEFYWSPVVAGAAFGGTAFIAMLCRQYRFASAFAAVGAFVHIVGTAKGRRPATLGAALALAAATAEATYCAAFRPPLPG